jgi:hypothetical protein
LHLRILRELRPFSGSAHFEKDLQDFCCNLVQLGESRKGPEKKKRQQGCRTPNFYLLSSKNIQINEVKIDSECERIKVGFWLAGG